MNERARTHLIEERKQRHWSQQETADLLGTTRPNISRWEAGLTTPSPYFRAKLCELFGKTARELELIRPNPSPPSPAEQNASAAAQANARDAGVHTIWTVPFGRNPQFTGRDELLVQLEQHFFSQGYPAPASPRCAALTQSQAITGLGGIGKTQIAVEYAYRAYEQGRYSHVLWINAASEETIMASFATLLEQLPAFPAKEENNQRKVIEAVKQWLERCSQPWLVIYDNADEVSLLQPYLSQRGCGSLLLTTRSHAVGSLAASIEVENMSLVEGTTFLLQRAQRQRACDEERDEATNVVIALDGFPLALDQAGAYVEETGCGFADYLEIYQKHHQALLARRGRQATNYPDSVTTTWSLSFQHIATRNPAAAELLHLCAFLAPDDIPEELLIQGATFWPAPLQQAVGERLSFQRLLEDLLRFSLVRRRGGERLLSLHRLVQVVQQDTLEVEERRQWAERVVRAVHAVFPADPKRDVASWPQCLRYLEQVQACDTLIQKYRLLLPAAAELFDRTGIYLSEHASYNLAESLFQRAVHIWEQTKGSESPEVAQSLNELAVIYLSQRKNAQAELFFQRALRIWEQALGPEHPDVSRPLNSLGVIYSKQGKYEQAEFFYQRSLHLREQALGPEHPNVASPLCNLADLYQAQGKYRQAEPLFQRALCILEPALGPDHPKVAYLLNSLAELYRVQEKYEQAEPLYLRALHLEEQARGPKHPLVAYLLNNLADLYRMQGKDEQAGPLYQRALHTLEQALGADNPDVGYPLNGLALLYSKQDRDEQAEQLLQRALHIWEQALGPGHANIASALTGLADQARKRSRDQEAEVLYQRALSIREHTLGPRHLDTAETLQGLATLRFQQGNLKEAISLYQRTLAIREQVLGAEHPQAIQARERLHAALASLERIAEEAQLEPTERKDVEKSEETSGELCSVLPSCPHCQNTSAVVKSGSNQSGSLRFRCQRCQRYFTPQSTPRGYESTRKEQAVLLAAQGMSYRSIARQLGVNHRTIRAWVTVHPFPNNSSENT